MRREQRALRHGADQLMRLAKFHFANERRVLLALRKHYADFCCRALAALERHHRELARKQEGRGHGRSNRA